MWNGGFDAFVFLTGLDYYSEAEFSLSIYGLYAQVLLVIFLLLLSGGLWWLMRRYVVRLGEGVEFNVMPQAVPQRALAAWALACLLVLVPIGAALGQAWSQIRTVFGFP